LLNFKDKRFIGALQQFCTVDINQNHRLKACTQDLRPGYALSCMMEHVHEIDQGSRCFQFLLRVEKVAFSDFALIAPFVEHCAAIIKQLGCGQLTKPSLHQNVRVPHSQGFSNFLISLYISHHFSLPLLSHYNQY